MIYLTVLLFFSCTTKAQFPDHVDLEKLGEVEFQNERYKILRPSLHKVTDHFKEFMMKTNTQSTNEKLLLDNNGFRHHWSTLNVDVPKGVRRNDIDIEKKIIEDSFEIIKGLSLSKEPEGKEPPKTAQNKVMLKTIMDQWKLDKDRLKTKLERKAAEKKLYPVETQILCPYFGLIRAKHYVNDEDENSILH
ncbi:hypothetical protein O0L34_g16202 [Tuta absoluta]|nr:hypothetical protein O0L34_g16202 [Tuta absoluta]